MRAAQDGASPTHRAQKKAVGGVIDKLLAKVRPYIPYSDRSLSFTPRPHDSSCLILHPFIFHVPLPSC